jgi:hypothetical protein
MDNMPTLSTAPKPMPSLPREEKKILLPRPRKHFWIFLALVTLPIILVIVYAVNPFFTFSEGSVRGIIRFAMGIFLVVLIFLIVAFAKFFIDIWKRDYTSGERDKNIIVLTLLFLLSLMLFSTTIYIILY